jgi:hypothetical protein
MLIYQRVFFWVAFTKSINQARNVSTWPELSCRAACAQMGKNTVGFHWFIEMCQKYIDNSVE